MITTFILLFFANFVRFWISFLPYGSLPTEVSTALAYFISVARSLNVIVPVWTALHIAYLLMLIELAIMLFKILQWLYLKIWGSR